MDEEDFVFVNRPVSTKEDKAFSEFLKSRKAKAKPKIKAKAKEKTS